MRSALSHACPPPALPSRVCLMSGRWWPGLDVPASTRKSIEDTFNQVTGDIVKGK